MDISGLLGYSFGMDLMFVIRFYEMRKPMEIYLVIAISIFITACTILTIMQYNKYKRKSKNFFAFKDENDIPSGILDHFPDKERWKLQTMVANARSVDDLLEIFSEFHDLQSLQLPTISDISTETHSAKAQAFRDLVRERVVVNDTPVEPGSSPSSDPSQFERDFEAHIQNAIARHVPDPVKRKNISMHLCCHLSRTRAGGDSFFAVQDVFTSPQLVITASPHYTHPPTDLLITEDGWAVITTTSNFDVYLQQDIADNLDDHPEPLVTISALTEEAIPIAESAQQSELAKFGQTCKSKVNHKPAVSSSGKVVENIQRMWSIVPGDEKYDERPLPIYRTLRLSCTLPAINATNWECPPDLHADRLEQDCNSSVGASLLDRSSVSLASAAVTAMSRTDRRSGSADSAEVPSTRDGAVDLRLDHQYESMSARYDRSAHSLSQPLHRRPNEDFSAHSAAPISNVTDSRHGHIRSPCSSTVTPSLSLNNGYSASSHGYLSDMDHRQRITDDSMHGLRELGLAFRKSGAGQPASGPRTFKQQLKQLHQMKQCGESAHGHPRALSFPSGHDKVINKNGVRVAKAVPVHLLYMKSE